VTFDPKSLDLGRLFVDPDMFDSRDDFRAAGFDVLRRSSDNTIMIGAHISAPGVLFKKYASALSADDQLENYDRRARGARELRRFVEKRGLRGIDVPEKRILELPRAFGRRPHILVVSRLDILGESASKIAYRTISEDVLDDLCEVVVEFPGLDSNTGNVPMTRSGHVAFVDTEHWRRRDEKPHLRHISAHLSRRGWERAQKILRRLEEY
jgi:hypothetical protein